MSKTPEIRPLPYMGEVLEFIIRNFSHISDKANGKLRKNLRRYKSGELCPPDEARKILAEHLPKAFQDNLLGRELFDYFAMCTSAYANVVMRINCVEIPASSIRPVFAKHFLPWVFEQFPQETFVTLDVDLTELMATPERATKLVWDAYLNKRNISTRELSMELSAIFHIDEKSYYDNLQNWVKGKPMTARSIISILESGDAYEGLALGLLSANAYRTFCHNHPSHIENDYSFMAAANSPSRLNDGLIHTIHMESLELAAKNGEIEVSSKQLSQYENYDLFRHTVNELVDPERRKTPEIFSDAHSLISFIESNCYDFGSNWEMGVLLGMFYVQVDQLNTAIAILDETCDQQTYRNGPAVKEILEYLLVIAAFTANKRILRKWRGWSKSMGIEIDIQHPIISFYKKFPPENFFPNVEKTKHTETRQKAAKIGLLVEGDPHIIPPDLGSPNRKRKGFESVPLPQLSIFAKSNQPEKIKKLLDADVDPNQLCTNSGSALLRAIEEKNGDCIDLLLPLTRLEIINTKTKDTKRTCLTVAVGNGDLELAQALLDAGADVEFRGENDCTALYVAVGAFIPYLDERHILDLVVNDATINELPPQLRPSSPFKGTQIEEIRSDMHRFLQVPAYRKLLDEMIAHSDKVPTKTGLDIVKLLLAHKADPNAKDRNGFTPFLHAAELGNDEVFFALLNAGGNVREKDVVGQTVLLALRSREHQELATRFISKISKEDVVWLEAQPDPKGYDPNRVSYY